MSQSTDWLRGRKKQPKKKTEEKIAYISSSSCHKNQETDNTVWVWEVMCKKSDGNSSKT